MSEGLESLFAEFKFNGLNEELSRFDIEQRDIVVVQERGQQLMHPSNGFKGGRLWPSDRRRGIIVPGWVTFAILTYPHPPP
jgi:hypothetical protein